MLLFVSTSCSNSTVETLSETSIQTESQTEPAIEYKTIDPPEDGWTLELLNEVSYINGKDIDLPFSVNDLGEDFSLEEVEYNKNTGYANGWLYYKGKSVFAISTDSYGNEFDENDKITNIITLFYRNESEIDLDNFFNINGVHIGDISDDFVKKIGKTDSYEDFKITYNGFDFRIDVFLDKESRITSIQFIEMGKTL
jgi:hypothetical protein